MTTYAQCSWTHRRSTRLQSRIPWMPKPPNLASVHPSGFNTTASCGHQMLSDAVAVVNQKCESHIRLVKGHRFGVLGNHNIRIPFPFIPRASIQRRPGASRCHMTPWRWRTTSVNLATFAWREDTDSESSEAETSESRVRSSLGLQHYAVLWSLVVNQKCESCHLRMA